MDCELCYDTFDKRSHIPKVLGNCGHTFCENCIIKLWKDGYIKCPVCRIKSSIFAPKDLPHTNHTLVKLHKVLDHRSKALKILNQYKIEKESGIPIHHKITRLQAPHLLKLISINSKNLLYKEEESEFQEDNQLSNIDRMLKKEEKVYCFNRDSILNSLKLNEYSEKMFCIHRKAKSCKHSFSCAENTVRKLFTNIGLCCAFLAPLAYCAKRLFNKSARVNRFLRFPAISVILALAFTLPHAMQCYFNFNIHKFRFQSFDI